MWIKPIVSHSREVYCQLFKDKIVYSIPLFFGAEAVLGSRIEVEVALQPREGVKKFCHSDLTQALRLVSTAQKDRESFTTRVSVEELR